MMEPVFMSNPAEAEWLTTTIHAVDEDGVVELDEAGGPTANGECINCRRAQIAQAIHQGIIAYFGGPETTPEPEPRGMHIANIEMNLEYKAVWTNATATITIDDDDGVPVEGATVYGEWGGATEGSDSGVTGFDGTALLESDRVKNAPIGTTFTVTVTNVFLNGWTWDDSGKTSDSISVP